MVGTPRPEKMMTLSEARQVIGALVTVWLDCPRWVGRLSQEGWLGRRVLDDWDGRLSKLRRIGVMLGMLGRLLLGATSQSAPVGAMRLVGDQTGSEVDAVRWDLGLQGLGLLVGMSLGFGVIAQLVVGRATTRWLWLIAAAGYFVGGLFVSEVWFGWATQEELQPNIDGLSFDEVLLVGLVPGVVAVLLARYLTRGTRRHRVGSASERSGTSRTRAR